MTVSERHLPTVLKLHLQDADSRERSADANENKAAYWERIGSKAKENWLFLICFVLPVAIAACYQIGIAAPMFVSEAKFIVRSSSISPRLGAGGNMGQVSSLVRTNDDTQSVNAYISSRVALDRLIAENRFLDIVDRPEADFLSRYPHVWARADRETLFERFSEYVDVSFDSGTGVSTLRIRAFRPEDAHNIASAMLNHSEELINKLNERARYDAISFAEEVAGRSEAKVQDAQARVASFRNREALFDPVRQAAVSLDLIAKLTAEIADLKTTLSELTMNSPDSPKVEAVRSRIAALQAQIAEQRSFIAGGDKSLAPKLAEYEKLTLEQELATKSFISALVSLEGAREEGHRKQLYLERIVEPNLPDKSLYPKRLQSILYIAAICLAIYWILSVLGAVVRDHDL
jgi:capsular polysaccharide transport system permease protein